jgi:hypothetical protein
MLIQQKDTTYFYMEGVDEKDLPATLKANCSVSGHREEPTS